MRSGNVAASGKVAKRQSGQRAADSRAPGLSTLNSQHSTPPARRGGAALIVVLALLGTLLFLGLLYYTFAAQELVSAENFATAPPASYPPAMFQDFALEQLILGTRPSLQDSALFSTNWSLIPNMIGRPIALGDKLVLADGAGNAADVNPFDGLGIGVWADTNNLAGGEFVFDYEGDGEDDTGLPFDFLDETSFGINFSPAANGGMYPAIVAESFHPDAGYTYPDVNSLFLAYDGFVRDPNNPGNDYRVIIPSFHRPQYIPAMRGIDLATADLFGSVFEHFDATNGPNTIVDTRNKVLRPHQDHVNSNDTAFQRFLTTATPALSGDTTRIIPPFPFRVDINSDGIANQAGVWSIADVPADPNDPSSPVPSSTVYEFDVDNDGDGFRDSIWMDLDHPIMNLPDGRQFVPMFAFKVIDADALLNVNAHGNMNGFLARGADGNPASGTPPTIAELYSTSAAVEPLSSSNLGLSRSEINLGMGLTASPNAGHLANDTPQGLAEAQAQHAANLNDSSLLTTALPPASLSNVELLALLTGREQYRDVLSGTPLKESQVEGRWGDDFNRVAAFYAWLQGAGSYAAPSAPGGYLIDDDGDSNVIGISSAFGTFSPPYPMSLAAGLEQDDDINAPVGHSGGGSAYRDPDLMGVWVPPFVHPLDYGGTGAGSLDASGVGSGSPITRRLAGFGSGITNPAQWPTYVNAMTNPFWQFQYTQWNPADPDPSTGSPVDAQYMVGNPYVQDPVTGGYRSLYGVLPYWQSLSAANELQFANVQHDFLIDDGNEVILNRRYHNPEYDAVFGAQEMEGLHLSSSDYQRVKSDSRLPQLAIVNFDKTNKDVGRLIRSRFTTDSWDRYEFGHGHSVGGTAQRDWEFTEWTGTGDYSADPDGGGPLPPAAAFPPEFGAVGGEIAAGSNTDPFRRGIRVLLKTWLNYSAHLNPNGSSRRFPRHRLNINRILSGEASTGGSPSFDSDGNPRFRNLTPHPNITALNIANGGGWGDDSLMIPAMVHANNTAAPVPFSDLGIAPNGGTSLAIAQEWWAQFDRQRLARDIYVLLWLLGGGKDEVNYATDSSPDYTQRQLTEMAQFAVNYVDALDRDDVITRFEYDKNLTTGWNISADNTPTHADYEVVYGVEAQQLTLSEVLWVQSTDTGSDETSTMWDDDEIREFMYIELRNVSPFDVEMRSDSWRISRYNPGSMTPDASFVFKTDPEPSLVNGENVVKAGKTFLIGCHDNSMTVNVNSTDEIRSSDFYVNDGAGSGFDQIVPYRIDGTDTNEPSLPAASGDHPAPTLDLDLSYTDGTGGTDHQERFEFVIPAPINSVPPMLNGNTLVSTESTWSGIGTCTIVLERRRNLRTDGTVNLADDDWVEVDRFENVARLPFNPGGTIADELDKLLSHERSEPLNRSDVDDHAIGTGTPPRNHTLGAPDFTVNNMDDDDDSTDRNQKNSNLTGTTFTIWQPHFDRDFSSVFELLSVPLIGPAELTEKLVDMTSNKLTGWYEIPDSMNSGVPALAGARFLNTDPRNNSPGAGNIFDDNRWYRLFEFLTVPDGGDDAIRERLELLVRTPGKININTIRDEAVLAAILDDAHIGRFSTPNPTDDAIQGVVRNWYRELQLARDGIDPLNWFGPPPGSELALPLPGVPGVPSDPTATPPTVQYGAVPFRSESYVAPDLSAWPDGSNVNKTAHTLLRKHVVNDPMIFQDGAGIPTRATNIDQLGLFEARPTTDIGTDAVDYHTRNRLLAKVANHTTNRSNVFIVWLTVGFFEAHQPDPTQPTVVQIGGEMEGMPRQRSFFVIDRTRLEEAVRVDDNGTPADATDDIITLDWRTFLLHRRTLTGE